jgi:hypothetical protein
MDISKEYILVSAPSQAGLAFIRLLLQHRIPFAAIVNNKRELENLHEIGVKNIILIDTTQEQTWHIPDYPIGNIYLFEKSFTLCCRYLRICRTWTSKPVYVITQSCNPRIVYKGLGADDVIHTNGDELSFWIHSPAKQGEA